MHSMCINIFTHLLASGSLLAAIISSAMTRSRAFHGVNDQIHAYFEWNMQTLPSYNRCPSYLYGKTPCLPVVERYLSPQSNCQQRPMARKIFKPPARASAENKMAEFAREFLVSVNEMPLCCVCV